MSIKRKLIKSIYWIVSGCDSAEVINEAFSEFSTRITESECVIAYKS